ncbi:MAG: TonB-dependent receptor [Steroidobacteraceae bacterium]
MKSFDRTYLIWALCYAAAGMGLGIYMGVSGNHGQFPTHAHIMLVGFVTSLIYAVIHRLWLTAPSRALATIQFILHQAGALAMFTGLFLIYGRGASEGQVGPLMGAATVAIVLGVLLMLVMVLKAGVRPAQTVEAVDAPRTPAN